MATVSLYPYSTEHSTGWTIIGSESTIHESLADDGAATTGAEATQETRYIEIELDDLSGKGLNIDKSNLLNWYTQNIP